MTSYRKPTEKESVKLDAARNKTQEGIEGEKDMLSKVSTTAAKSARDYIKTGSKMRESVSASAREGEAYNHAGYKKGGKIMSKKTKRFNEGGELEFETKQGKNEMIDDGVRARAMAAMEKGSSDEAPAKKSAPSFKAKADKAGFTSAETKGGAALMTRKDRSSTPKAAPKKSSSYTADHSMGNAMKMGGSVGSASKRADGCATKGKTKGRMV